MGDLFKRDTEDGKWVKQFGFDDAALTGDPTAPTPAEGDGDTSVSTTAFVQDAVRPARETLIPPLATAANIVTGAWHSHPHTTRTLSSADDERTLVAELSWTDASSDTRNTFVTFGRVATYLALSTRDETDTTNENNMDKSMCSIVIAVDSSFVLPDYDIACISQGNDTNELLFYLSSEYPTALLTVYLD